MHKFFSSSSSSLSLWRRSSVRLCRGAPEGAAARLAVQWTLRFCALLRLHWLQPLPPPLLPRFFFPSGGCPVSFFPSSCSASASALSIFGLFLTAASSSATAGLSRACFVASAFASLSSVFASFSARSCRSNSSALSGLRDPRPPHYLLHDHRRKCGSYAPLRPECVTGSVAIMPLCDTAC